MVTTYVVVLVALSGLLLYGFAANPKIQEIGRILFLSGVFVGLLVIAGGHVVRFP